MRRSSRRIDEREGRGRGVGLGNWESAGTATMVAWLEAVGEAA